MHYVPHFSEKRMIMEINWGLGRDTNPSSNIKSYITYVSQLPSGQESGQYLALDLGGTNFRVLLVSTVLYCTVMYCTVLYYTVLYRSAWTRAPPA